MSASAKGDLVMRLVEVRPLAIVWYAYAPDSRILITASGPRCRSLSGLQVSMCCTPFPVPRCPPPSLVSRSALKGCTPFSIPRCPPPSPDAWGAMGSHGVASSSDAWGAMG